jgi:hypothetical protein
VEGVNEEDSKWSLNPLALSVPWRHRRSSNRSRKWERRRHAITSGVIDEIKLESVPLSMRVTISLAPEASQTKLSGLTHLLTTAIGFGALWPDCNISDAHHAPR